MVFSGKPNLIFTLLVLNLGQLLYWHRLLPDYNSIIRKYSNIQTNGLNKQKYTFIFFPSVYLHSPFDVIWRLACLVFVDQVFYYLPRFIKLWKIIILRKPNKKVYLNFSTFMNAQTQKRLSCYEFNPKVESWNTLELTANIGNFR